MFDRSRRGVLIGAAALLFLLLPLGTLMAVALGGEVVTSRLNTLDPAGDEFFEDVVYNRLVRPVSLLAAEVEAEPLWWLGHGTGTASPYAWRLAVDRRVEEAFLAEVLYQTGLLGLVGYLALFAAVIVQLRHSLHAAADAESAIWARIFAVYLIHVIYQALEGGEVLAFFPSNMLFWLVLGGTLRLPHWQADSTAGRAADASGTGAAAARPRRVGRAPVAVSDAAAR